MHTTNERGLTMRNFFEEAKGLESFACFSFGQAVRYANLVLQFFARNVTLDGWEDIDKTTWNVSALKKDISDDAFHHLVETAERHFPRIIGWEIDNGGDTYTFTFEVVVDIGG